ncbi:hypothetical protein HK103_003028 [Boothiomyces macroporosus]|uniref:GTP-binding protein n=2 Tax=Boothiomyces macroporosus TaxID=261099 RepID=A0AAD5UCP3_9FUNG|nr:hypothetical protein HK103_003028 [Boothiomyces macroporosus]
MQANETLYLEQTLKIHKINISSFIDFQVWDCPDSIELDFFTTNSLVYIVDAQDDYIESLHKLIPILLNAYSQNPKISFEIFIHKVDGLSDDDKIDIQRDVFQRINDELIDNEKQINLSFHQTSIYDHSIFEAFSKIVQKLITELPALENLLNMFCSNSGIEKAFIFDLNSKIYIATDSSPVDMQSYELCSDMIDVILDMTFIYSNENPLNSIIHLDNGMLLYLYTINE